nr:MAG TPA: hypothetical protein [Caudoviricetes sp.]
MAMPTAAKQRTILTRIVSNFQKILVIRGRQ